MFQFSTFASIQNKNSGKRHPIQYKLFPLTRAQVNNKQFKKQDIYILVQCLSHYEVYPVMLRCEYYVQHS